ncbi:Lipase (class 3) [Vibrio sp. B1FLJ16]|uniref:lipase family protein n=1 Tax=Vibrio sp. B1FLJ16 TaxID=2751178 RepID=UPI0015F62AD8|nr:lipase family protein [Vibrio sp. B1FLJ16]CAD7816724.1 Lipase (class 3) [Vibrio sp. B1FLJ16]CAE6929190.1 Lipase (class 3) [Vibrio sp. B1FLJ16]
MAILTPKLAYEIAYLPYQLVTHRDKETIELSNEIRKAFSFNKEKQSFHGKTGGIFGFGRKSEGFALVGLGKGKHKDELVITVRGTKKLNDWITNLNLGLKGSPNGSHAHAGFINTFHTIRPQIRSFILSQSKMPKLVHCVGHSLGGALASLFSDWLKDEFSMRVNLYTFGTPRVGHESYARKSDHTNINIFRCTHGADPVPLIPLWPFQHAPYSGMEYRLDDSNGIYSQTHGMGPHDNPGYINTANSLSWDSLKQSSNQFLNKPIRLKFESRSQAAYNSYWASKLSAALTTLLKDAGPQHYRAIEIQARLSSGMTFYDQLARSVEKVAAVSGELAEQTKGLLGHMLVFSGRFIDKINDLSAKFIRWVFDVTIGKLFKTAQRALSSLF